MVDTSSMYNLSNPALNDDIGLNNLDKTLPMAPSTFYGSNEMSWISMRGQLSQDTFQPSRKEKDKSIFKKILLGAGIIGAGILTFKGGKKVFGLIKKGFTKLKAKFKK